MKRIIIFLFAFMLVPMFAVSAENGNIISEHAEYRLITAASVAYPDDGMKLCDGIYGTVPDGKTNYYSGNAYVGFNIAEADVDGNFVIIFDLQTVHHDISAFTIGFLNETSAGIYAPKSVSFSVCETRNGEYMKIGTLRTEKQTAPALSTTYAETLANDDVSGRYVKITITPLREFVNDRGEIEAADWTFIDEIAVYSSGNANNISNPETSSSTESAPFNEDTPNVSQSAPPENSKPETGDAGLQIFAFLLLAVSAVTMIFALVCTEKKTEEF